MSLGHPQTAAATHSHTLPIYMHVPSASITAKIVQGDVSMQRQHRFKTRFIINDFQKAEATRRVVYRYPDAKPLASTRAFARYSNLHCTT